MKQPSFMKSVRDNTPSKPPFLVPDSVTFHGALHQFLKKFYPRTAAAFASESQVPLERAQDNVKISDLLEKKWVASSILQFRVCQLDRQVKNMGRFQKLYDSLSAANSSTKFIPNSSPAYKIEKEHQSGILKLVASPVDGSFITVDLTSNLKVWDTERDGKPQLRKSILLSSMRPELSLTDVVFDDSGRYLLITTTDPKPVIVDMTSSTTKKGRTSLMGHSKPVLGSSFVLKTGLPTTFRQGGTENTGNTLLRKSNTFRVKGSMHGEELHDDESAVVTVSADGTFKMWDMKNGVCVKTVDIPTTGYFKTGGIIKFFATTGGHFGPVVAAFVTANNPSIAIWHIDEKKEPSFILSGHKAAVECIVFGNPQMVDALRGASKDQGASVGSGVVPAAKGTGLFSKRPSVLPKSKGVYNNVLFSGGRDNTIHMWIISTTTESVGESSHDFKLSRVFTGHSDWVSAIACHPNGVHLLSCSHDMSIKFWNVQTGECVKTIGNAHGALVSTVAYSRSTPIMLTGAVDSSVYIWNCLEHKQPELPTVTPPPPPQTQTSAPLTSSRRVLKEKPSLVDASAEFLSPMTDTYTVVTPTATSTAQELAAQLPPNIVTPTRPQVVMPEPGSPVSEESSSMMENNTPDSESISPISPSIGSFVMIEKEDASLLEVESLNEESMVMPSLSPKDQELTALGSKTSTETELPASTSNLPSIESLPSPKLDLVTDPKTSPSKTPSRTNPTATLTNSARHRSSIPLKPTSSTKSIDEILKAPLKASLSKSGEDLTKSPGSAKSTTKTAEEATKAAAIKPTLSAKLAADSMTKPTSSSVSAAKTVSKTAAADEPKSSARSTAKPQTETEGGVAVKTPKSTKPLAEETASTKPSSKITSVPSQSRLLPSRPSVPSASGHRDSTSAGLSPGSKSRTREAGSSSRASEPPTNHFMTSISSDNTNRPSSQQGAVKTASGTSANKGDASKVKPTVSKPTTSSTNTATASATKGAMASATKTSAKSTPKRV